MEAWVSRAFAGDPNNPNPVQEDRGTGEFIPEDDVPTFGPFSDVFVVLAVAEDLESQDTKGETLKEMEMLEKAGLQHPGESTVVYALKQTIPGIFAKGTGTPKKTALKALKTPSEWDKVFSKDMSRGLKDVLEERHDDIESVIRGHIDDSLTRHGHHEAAALAREMLSESMKFVTKLSAYMTDTCRDLTERSGFLPEDAWLLTTQVVARVFKAMNTARSEIRSVTAKSSPTRNTAKVLFALLRVHDVMKEFLGQEIKNHPSISSEYVKFLASHMGYKDVLAVKKKLEAVEKRTSDTDKEVKVALANSKSAQSEAKTAQNVAKEAKTLSSKK